MNTLLLFLLLCSILNNKLSCKYTFYISQKIKLSIAIIMIMIIIVMAIVMDIIVVIGISKEIIYFIHI